MTAAAAIVIRREKDAVAAYRSAGATTPGRAHRPEGLGVTNAMAIRRLTSRAVLRPGTEPGTLYLDEPSWTALRSMRRRMAVVLVIVGCAFALASWYAGTHLVQP